MASMSLGDGGDLVYAPPTQYFPSLFNRTMAKSAIVRYLLLQKGLLARQSAVPTGKMSVRQFAGTGQDSAALANMTMDQRVKKTWDLIAALLARTRQECEAHGAVFLLVFQGQRWEIEAAAAGKEYVPPAREVDPYCMDERINDMGRPYAAGVNAVSGLTADAVAGRLAFSFQAEYQSAPGLPPGSPQVLQAIASADGTPVLAGGGPPAKGLELLDSTVALKLVGDIQISFGKQSLWLGPGEAGPLLFSDNAPPVAMLRLDSVSPYKLPLLSRVLGPARSEFFLGQLTGHHWVSSPPHFYGPVIHPQPFLEASKISFRPTPNLEFGLGFTAVFAGPGLPFTWHNFVRTFYQHKASAADNPGKRFSAFDLSYRIPGLRKWLEFYADSLVIDEYSPLGSSHPAIHPGIYLPQIPKIRKLDFRLEGVATDLPTMPAHFGIGTVYSDSRYHSGYTNHGMLMGNWMGRMGRGEQAWATYWCSSRSKLQAGYRQQDVNRAFLEGGRLQDFSLRTEVFLRPDLSVSGSLQYERWRFPLLSAGLQQNLSSTVQLAWWPAGRKKK